MKEPQGANLAVALAQETVWGRRSGRKALRRKAETGARLFGGNPLRRCRVTRVADVDGSRRQPRNLAGLSGFCENGADEKAPQRLFCGAEADAARALTSADSVSGYI